MIIVETKPLEEIINMVKDQKSILVVGCEGCTAITQAGGEKQAEVMARLLEMGLKTKENKEIKIKAISILRQCDKRIVANSLRPFIEDYEAILSMACGVGVQTVADIFEHKKVFPAQNTKFMGSHDRETGRFSELCKACGECILDETGGICPLTRCAKGLLNGPCGGYAKGKCEVGGWTHDCAWVLIFNRLKAQGRLDLFTKFRPPRDNQLSQSPRELGGE
ncbi:hypothetical protein DRO26_03605 [Candidatus Bathyarchaeota archaeon]|nr:MAG: hypothetical protein DRO26_03605 [Candidatus Bathyarchaeota archaeon]